MGRKCFKLTGMRVWALAKATTSTWLWSSRGEHHHCSSPLSPGVQSQPRRRHTDVLVSSYH